MTDKKSDAEPRDPTNPDLEGFSQADTDVDDYPAWDFDKNPLLRGTVEKLKRVTLTRRGEETDVPMAVVLSSDGELVLLWHSANLDKFFEVIEAGDSIHVELTGKRNLSGQRTMKLFDAFYRRG